MKRIGRYEIERELGRGSMGVVYLAFDPRVKRRLAIKTYHTPEGLSAEEAREFRERFLREAQAAAVVEHPAIVSVHDAGEDSRGVPFIAMEYVRGPSLKEFVRSRGKLPAEQAFEMAETLAGALHAAHRARVVHRDVKPANILLRESDTTFKLTDFGVARLASSELTRTGLTLGSPAYMSPEQIRGKTIDGRSDLFSLGVVLYEALSGKKPFDGPDLASMAYAVAHETPIPVSRHVAGLPKAVDDFFDRALAKDAGERFPDGKTFRDALRAARTSSAAGRADGTATVVAAISGSSAPGPAAGAGLARNLSSLVHPGRRGLIAATVLVLLLSLGGWSLWSVGRRATMILEGRSSFEDATLSVLLDDEEVYLRTLAAERKSVRLFGKKLFKYGKEFFETEITMTPGRHEIVARVSQEGRSTDYEDKIVLMMDPGEVQRVKLISIGSPARGVVLEPE